VVISPDEMNHNLRTIVIAPVTSTLKKYPTRISMTNNNVKGMVAIDQIRTIDKQRIIKTIGNLEMDTIEQIKRIIEETYVK
ncbi:MAG: type II toxin-antitoxin system PemK/MazF family toxin, partial [Saprospiraceae bacterium]